MKRDKYGGRERKRDPSTGKKEIMQRKTKEKEN